MTYEHYPLDQALQIKQVLSSCGLETKADAGRYIMVIQAPTFTIGKVMETAISLYGWAAYTRPCQLSGKAMVIVIFKVH